MQVHCPECSQQFDCQVAGAGEVLTCPGCQARFKISAKETVFYLDSLASGEKTVVVGPDGGRDGEQALEADKLRPGDRLEGYRIEREIGRGGMGIVYLATQLSLGKQVAVKVLPSDLAGDKEFVQRFHRETRALAELSHPHIVNVIDKGHYQGIYYFVMEYVEGVTLRALLAERKLTPDEALRLVPQICGALEYAHSKGVIHRDIKPENIILDRQGNAKITDFGLSKILGQTHVSNITRTNAVMGTYEYMAPEQRTGAGSVDHRADLYSLGVVLYEMLTGEVPAGKWEPPSRRNNRLGTAVDRIIMRVLDRDPDRRYQKASELATDVERAAKKRPTLPKLAGVTLGQAAGTVWDFMRKHAWWFYVLLIMIFFARRAIPVWCFVGLTVLFWDIFGSDDKDEDEDEDDEDDDEDDDEKRKKDEHEHEGKDSVPVARATAGASVGAVKAEVVAECAPGSSGLALLGWILSLPLLAGSVALLLLSGVIRDGLLHMGDAGMAGVLVGIWAGALPGLAVLALCFKSHARCCRLGLSGRGLATWGAMFSLAFLGSVAFLAWRPTGDLLRWRTIESLARKGDSETLIGLEHEIRHPAFEGTRHRAARILAQHSPDRVAGYAESKDRAVRLAALQALADSDHEKPAVEAALRVMKGEPDAAEAQAAAEILVRYRPAAALDLLQKQVRESLPHRALAAQTIVAYRSPQAVAALELVAGDESLPSFRRMSACQRLGEIATPQAARALVRLLAVQDYSVRQQADQALKRAAGHPAGTGFQPGYSPASGYNDRAIQDWDRIIERWEARRPNR